MAKQWRLWTYRPWNSRNMPWVLKKDRIRLATERGQILRMAVTDHRSEVAEKAAAFETAKAEARDRKTLGRKASIPAIHTTPMKKPLPDSIRKRPKPVFSLPEVGLEPTREINPTGF